MTHERKAELRWIANQWIGTGATVSATSAGLVFRELLDALDADHPHTAALRALVEAHKEWDDLDGQLCGGTNDRALLDAVDAAYNRMDAAYEQARALLGGAR